MSLINNRNKVGPSTLPCGTPLVTQTKWECIVYCILYLIQRWHSDAVVGTLAQSATLVNHVWDYRILAHIPHIGLAARLRWQQTTSKSGKTRGIYILRRVFSDNSSCLNSIQCDMPIQWRIKFKLSSLTFKATHYEVPPYLSRLLIPYCLSRVLG